MTDMLPSIKDEHPNRNFEQDFSKRQIQGRCIIRIS